MPARHHFTVSRPPSRLLVVQTSSVCSPLHIRFSSFSTTPRLIIHHHANILLSLSFLSSGWKAARVTHHHHHHSHTTVRGEVLQCPSLVGLHAMSHQLIYVITSRAFVSSISFHIIAGRQEHSSVVWGIPLLFYPAHAYLVCRHCWLTLGFVHHSNAWFVIVVGSSCWLGIQESLPINTTPVVAAAAYPCLPLVIRPPPPQITTVHTHTIQGGSPHLFQTRMPIRIPPVTEFSLAIGGGSGEVGIHRHCSRSMCAVHWLF